jgi:hypothetical protein
LKLIDSPMIDSQHDEHFAQDKRSVAPKVLASVSALIITALVFAGYALLRKRHAQDSAGLVTVGNGQPAGPREPPKALITVDEALLHQGNTILGGTVKNTSAENLEGLAVELELKRRKDGGAEMQSVRLEPAQLKPQQEGRYSLQLKVQDYSSARLAGLKASPNVSLAYTTAQGQKRPPERIESKTITVGKASSTPGGFLNSPDNPARVP